MSRLSRLAAAAGVALCLWLFAKALRVENDLPRVAETDPGAEASPSGTGYPRTVVGYLGKRLRIERPPRAIASQALVIDHLLFAIGADERVVSVSAPATDPRFSFIADRIDPSRVVLSTNVEAVVRQGADLMLLSHSARADFESVLRSAGIPSIRMHTWHASFDEVAEALRLVGRITGSEDAADEQVLLMRQRINVARNRRPADAEPPRVLPYSVYGSTYGTGSLIDHVLEELGAINVSAQHGVGPVAEISSEQVASWNPDWIVAGAEVGAAEATLARLRSDPGIAVSGAGESENFIIVDSRMLISMSHHAVGLMEAIATRLYPEGP